MTCGEYRIKVSPGNVLDTEQENRLSPDTVWVSITTTSDYWRGRTDRGRVEKNRDGKTNVWNKKIGLGSVYDVIGYYDDAAVIEKTGVFKIAFAIEGKTRVSVSCSDTFFSNKPYPVAMCGTFMGNGTVGEIISDVLSNDDVTQREICAKAAAQFRACPENKKAEAAEVCGRIYGHNDLSSCLVTEDNMMGEFERCLRAVCKSNNCACKRFYKKVRSCGLPYGHFSDLTCFDEIHSSQGGEDNEGGK
ncbi:uncharacterized protein LOC143289576 [Babylonia areolata]|uniref:uncharacterized protein LOC143289576 n=1 Tax=Babylonia areolata TaxID=304850 RepID=UPI003FD1F814